jgi:hypothetical protein
VDHEDSRDVGLVLGVLREYATTHQKIGDDEEEMRDFMTATLQEIVRRIVEETEAECGEDLKRVIEVIVNRARKPTSVHNRNDSQPRSKRRPAELTETSRQITPQTPLRKEYPQAASVVRGSVDTRSSSVAEISIRPRGATYDHMQVDGKMFQEDEHIGGNDNEISHRKRKGASFQNRSKTAKHTSVSSPGAEEESSSVGSGIPVPRSGLHPVDTNISGSPFIRAPIRDRRSTSLSESPSRQGETARLSQITMLQGSESKRPGSPSSKIASDSADSPTRPPSERLSRSDSRRSSTIAKIEPQVVVPVGLSCLHLVELPSLKVSASQRCFDFLMIYRLNKSFR